MPRRYRLHLLDARRAARSHRSAPGDAASSRRRVQRRQGAARRAARAVGRPRPARVADSRPLRRQGARRREGAVPDRRLRPARDRSRCPRLRSDAAADGRIRSLPADSVRRACVRCEARRAATVLWDRRCRRRYDALRRALGVDKIALDGISYGTYVGERYALAHPTTCRSSCSTPSSRTSGSATSAPSSSARPRVSCAPFAETGASPTSPRSSSGITTALTSSTHSPPTASSTRPTAKCSTSRRCYARRATEHQARWSRLSRACMQATRHPPTHSPGPPRKHVVRGLAVSVGQLVGAARRSRRGAAARGVEAADVRALPVRPRDRRRQRLPSPVPALAADAADAARPGEDPRPDPARERKPRFSTPLEWAKQELARTTNGKLVVVPGAGHSTQSRSVSDVSRKAVAAFLLG